MATIPDHMEKAAGWAKRSVPTSRIAGGHGAKRAFAHPTELRNDQFCDGIKRR
jgi:hypothetical protein